MASDLGHFFPPTAVTRLPDSGQQNGPSCLSVSPTPNILLLSSLGPCPSFPYFSLFLTFLGGGGEGQENSALPSLVQVLT